MKSSWDYPTLRPGGTGTLDEGQDAVLISPASSLTSKVIIC